MLDKVLKIFDEYLIDLVYSVESFSLRIDPAGTLLPYVHHHDLQFFIIPVEARLSVSTVCCSSDMPLCNWGNVTVIHQAICLFGGSQYLSMYFLKLHVHLLLCIH